MNSHANAAAGPSRLPRKPARPFVSSDHRPVERDGIFRVVLITSGSVASIRGPDIAAALSLSDDLAVQVITTKPASHFCNQANVDEAVNRALGVREDQNDRDDVGVRVWTDEDEWSDWKKVGDPILHIELRRWADLVVVAPCSANTLAKIAGGLCDNLATSLLRALSPDTPVIICPAMNTHMYQHKFTSKHLRIIQEELEYLILGPQGAGKLACGDEGPGKMTDWREIVYTIENFALMHEAKIAQEPVRRRPVAPSLTYSTSHPSINGNRTSLPSGSGSGSGSYVPNGQFDGSSRPPTPPTPNRPISDLPSIDSLKIQEKIQDPQTGQPGDRLKDPKKLDPKTASLEHWKSMQDDYWKMRWWA
ncbi:uncharacterized protein IL334_003345 [Kwoniella shivajii]|uniref:Flavoprotein domain-containing protein n=1 Tax=Kwoniella shivajii TaxID=564305 RepID=A0ABZ1CXL5_9TREE|nr:hypothetical protein IL334_003345 [Kwoniella shivajii]